MHRTWGDCNALNHRVQVQQSTAVCLPTDFQIADRKVQIFRQGTDIVIRPTARTLVEAVRLPKSLPGDMFTESRDVSPPQERDWW